MRLSIGPSAAALTSNTRPGSGDCGAAKATSRVGFQWRDAAAPPSLPGSSVPTAAASVATTTCGAESSLPSSRITRPGSARRTRAPSRTASAGSPAANCRGIASMPPRGRQARPSENIAKSKRNTGAAVSSDRSRNTPPKKGTKNRRMKAGEKPRAASSSRVVRSAVRPTPPRSSRPARKSRTAAPRKRAVRRPSAMPTVPSSRPENAASGRRHGSATRRSRPPSAISAPGSNAPRSRAAWSSCRRPSG